MAPILPGTTCGSHRARHEDRGESGTNQGRGGRAMAQELEGKVALVTGAGSGIGEACARLLAERGAKVVVADLKQDAAERVAGDIGDAALAVAVDVGDVASCLT